jgi:hypothetical protein
LVALFPFIAEEEGLVAPAVITRQSDGASGMRKNGVLPGDRRNSGVERLVPRKLEETAVKLAGAGLIDGVD